MKRGRDSKSLRSLFAVLLAVMLVMSNINFSVFALGEENDPSAVSSDEVPGDETYVAEEGDGSEEVEIGGVEEESTEGESDQKNTDADNPDEIDEETDDPSAGEEDSEEAGDPSEEDGSPEDASEDVSTDEASAEEGDSEEYSEGDSEGQQNEEVDEEGAADVEETQQEEGEAEKTEEPQPAKKKAAKAPQAAPLQAAEASDAVFDLVWLEGEDTTTLSDNNHKAVDSPTADTINNSDHHLEAQVSFGVGHTDDPIPAGGVQIKVPARIYTDWDGNATGETIIGVTQKPVENDKLFWYYYEDKNGDPVTATTSGGVTTFKDKNGNTLTGVDDVFIVIENSQAINNPSGSRTDFTCMINYGFRPTKVDTGEAIELNAKYIINGEEQSGSIVKNDKLTAEVNTDATLSDVSKKGHTGDGSNTLQYDSWQEEWGEMPSSLSGTSYTYVIYDIRATVKDVTQPYTLELKEWPGNDGQLVAYTGSSYSYSGMDGQGWTYTTTSSTAASVNNIKAIDDDRKGPKMYVEHHGTSTIYDPRYYSTAVVIAYPSAQVPPGTEVTNKVDVTLTPASGDHVQILSAETSYKIRDIQFIYDGYLYRIDKWIDDAGSYLVSSSTIDNAKFFLENDSDALLYNWVLIPKARGYHLLWAMDKDVYGGKLKLDGNGNPIKKSDYYSVDTIEDMVFLNGELLGPGDYTLVSASCTPYAYNYDPISGGAVSVGSANYDWPVWYYRTEAGGDWFPLNDGNPIESSSKQYLPEGAVEIKWHIEGDKYYYEPRMYITMRLNPTDHVKQLLTSGGDTAQVIDVASLGVYDSDGNIQNDFGSESILGDSEIGDQVKAHDQNQSNELGLAVDKYLQHDRATQFLGDSNLDTVFAKTEVTSKRVDDNAEQVSKRTFELTSNQPMIFGTGGPEDMLTKIEAMGIEHGQKEVYFYDLLPESAELDQSTISAKYYELNQSSVTSSGYADTSTEVIGNTEVSTIRNWRDSNRTLVIVKVTFPEGERSDWGIRYNEDDQLLGLGTQVKLTMELTFPWENIAFYGKHAVNYAASQIPGSYAGSPDDLSVESSGATNIPTELEDAFKNISEASGYDSEGNDTYYSKEEVDFNIATSSRSGYSKTVKSSIESSYRSNSAEVSDGIYTYRLRYQVEKGSQAKNIVVYDVLEEAWSETGNSDKYDDTERYWEGTFASATASQPTLLGAAPVIYYSTWDKAEMQNALKGLQNTEYADLSNTKYWKVLDDSVDKSTITAIAFDLRKDKNGNDFVLSGGNDATSVIYLYIEMQAPNRDRVLNYDDGEGSLMDPKIVYAYNNSFLNISSKSSSGDWTNAHRALSDGTTVRIAEPNPDIHKNVTDIDSGDEDDEVQVEHADLEKRNEPFKYEIDTKVPTFGNESSGQKEVNKWTVVDELEPVLQMVKKDQIKITIGEETGDKYFSYDAGTNEYVLKLKTEEKDSISGEAVWIDESGTGLPKGFALVMDNQRVYNQYGYTSTSTITATNTLKFTLGYDGFIASNPETTKDTPANPLTYDRVDEFAGEPVHIEFYAQIKDGVSLGDYEDAGTILVPNQAKYIIPNKNNEKNVSEKVTVTPPEEPPVKPKKTIDGVEQVFYLVDKATGEVKTKTVTAEDGSTNEVPVKLTLNTDTGEYEDSDGNVVTPAEDEAVKTKYEMEQETETLNYTITGQIPANAKNYTLSDTLESVLEFTDTDNITIQIKGTAQVYETDEYGAVVYDADGVPSTIEQNYDRTLTWKEAQALSSTSYNAGKGFNASLEGQTLSLALDMDFINASGDAVVSSSAVNYDEETNDETGEVTIKNPTLEGLDGTGITYSNTPSVSYPKNFALSGAEIIISFSAKIKDGADLSAYATETGTEIPNVATHRINNNPSENSDPVVVEPPVPPIFKRVNNKAHENLDGVNQVFNYLINVKIPEMAEDGSDVESLVIYDTLEPVLEFQNVEADGTDTFKAEILDAEGTTVYTLSGDEVTAGLTFPDGATGQKIEFSLVKALIDQYPGYRLAISFDARIRTTATQDDLNRYRENNSTRVPNESNYKINNDFDYKSNVVTVTPPNIGKTVNNVNNITVMGLEESFEYEVSAVIPVSTEGDEITSFVISDNMVDVLEFTELDSTVASVGGTELTEEELNAQVKREGQTITFTQTKAQIDANGGGTAALKFKAKIKEGADLTPYEEGTGIPNTVKYVINDDPLRSRTSRPVYVNPPEIGKLVNEKQHEDLASQDEVFTYKITALIPKTARTAPDEEGNTVEADVTSFYIKDEIKDVLEFAEEDATTVKVGDSDLTEDEISKQVVREGQLIRLDLTEDQVAENRGKYVVLEFKAKIRDDADLSEYVTDSGSVVVPNTSTKGYNVPDGPEEGYEVDSNEVTVTPPPIEKKVNGKAHEDLESADDAFTYSIKTWIPVTDKQYEKVTSFKITDTLEDVLEIADEDGITVEVDGEAVDAEISVQGQTLTVTLGEEQIEANPRKSVVVTFEAKVKEGANLDAYRVTDEETGEEAAVIPNKARYQVNNDAEVESNTVTVTPPDVSKKVNDKPHADLADWDEVFTYKISTFVPKAGSGEEITSVIFWDELLDVLEFYAEDMTEFTVGGEDQDISKVKREGQKLSVDLTEYVADHAGEMATVMFKAKLKSGVTMDDLEDYVTDVSTAEVPNEAKVTIKLDNGSERELKSKPVTVTPPPIEKKVNNKEHDDLAVLNEIFEYSIRAWVPVSDLKDEKATSFKIIDTLEDVLEFVEEEPAAIIIDGNPLTEAEVKAQTEIDGQTITFSLTEEQIENNPKKFVEVTFKAKIKEGADLDGYITDDEVMIPNKASYQINNDAEVESNTVTVTPPDEDNPPIKKAVNDKEHENLESKRESFTYKISTSVPTDASKFVVTDTLEDVLEFIDGTVNVTIGGEVWDGTLVEENVSISGQTITLTLEGDLVAEARGRGLTLIFGSIIKEGANLDPYKTDAGTMIPNYATYKVNDDPSRDKDSNTVTVKPPTPNPPEVDKVVDGSEKTELLTKTQTFEYTITSSIPVDTYKMEISDVLEDVLEFTEGQEVKVSIDGEDVEAQVEKKGQKLTVLIGKEVLTANYDKTVEVRFTANLKEGADLTPYKTADNEIDIPNVAEVTINDDPYTTSSTKPARIIPPNEEEPPIKKYVNGKDHENLKAGDEVFTYRIETAVPVDAEKFVVSDTLEKVLEFTGAEDTKVTLGGKDLSAAEIEKTVKRDGQVITLTLDGDLATENAGQIVTLVFKAKIKAGANLNPYVTSEGVRIPNKASYQVNDDPARTRESNVVTVTPPYDRVKTGDSTNIWMWIALLVVAAVAGIGVTIFRKRKE